MQLGVSQSSLTRAQILDRVNQQMPELIRRVNLVVNEAQKSLNPRRLLIVVEGLDKIDLDWPTSMPLALTGRLVRHWLQPKLNTAGVAAGRDYRNAPAFQHLDRARQEYERLEDSPERTPLASAGKADVLGAQAWLFERTDQYDAERAERLYRQGLEICQAIREPQGIAVSLCDRQLGELPLLGRGRPQDALPLLETARQGFAAIGLDNWLPGVDIVGACPGAKPLPWMICWPSGQRVTATPQPRSALRRICADMLTSANWAPIGQALRRIVASRSLEDALVDLPADRRAYMQAALQAQ